MDTKTLFGITVVPLAVLGGIILGTASRRIRDLFFFLYLLLAINIEHLDVNFVSREWYRGTSRGFEFSCLDPLIIGVFFGCLFRPQPGQRRWFWPASLGLALLFFLYAGFSVAISDPQLWGLFELSKMLRGTIVFLAAALYIRSERELRVLVTALACAVSWQGLLVLYQRYHLGIHRVTGVIGDPNSLSMYLCMAAPVFVAAITSNFPRIIKCLSILAILLGGVAMVMTISRTGVITMLFVLAATAVACVKMEITPKKIMVGLLSILIAGGVVGKAWNTLEDRFKDFTASDIDTNSKAQGRAYYFKIATAIAEDRWLGVGLNNWSYHVSNEYGPALGWHFVPYIGTENYPSDKVPAGRNNLDAAQAAPAHNLGALTVGELGIPGLFLFALLWLRWFQMGASFLWRRIPDPVHRLGVGLFFSCCGVFLQSLTEWVYRQLPIYFSFHILLGALASLYFIKHQRQEVDWEEDFEAGEEEVEEEESIILEHANISA
ncbi:O-antigen ligase family protein [Pedosphaera parvula]|uniref:O-antigen ligase-related domain-containing protein n=1 Tax=Pedosphaera parvula (strain Ellin514) TaxID=320771 RepID=B9X9S8_PEDPL|nr:O-antigen ligase family protein [Pedosphaera parvula]EEF63229.1 hypothetical protein Cflav_PD5864 [Pedosphaera parvula Ellin514]